MSESNPIDSNILEYLSKETLVQYRSLKWIKERYKTEDKSELIKYLYDSVFPSTTNQINKNVRQGDFGEILSTLIVEKFQNLKVPISKLRYKFNKDRSVFCTDLVSINQGEVITDIKYYEVKTRITYAKDTAKKAYEGLAKDEAKLDETIADFLDRLYFEQAEVLNQAGNSEEAETFYKISKQFGEIVRDPTKFNRSFEIVLIIEKNVFNEEMINELNGMSILLSPIEVSIFLVDNLKHLVSDVYQGAEHEAIKFVYS